MFLRFSLFFIFLFAGFYSYYLYKYPEPHNTSYLLEHYPKDLIIRRGAKFPLPKNRIQHFKNFPEQKEKNTIRIGAFGDSFTYGNEVDKTESYPYKLQMMFIEKHPHKKIEVLNFGEGGDGFQEQFFLWESYRKKYQLDYILLGPRKFHYERDNTFKQNFDMYHGLEYPKHRFILTKEGVSIKEVYINPAKRERKKTEEILKKRYKTYYRLTPSWTALRYDKKPFQIWEFLFPFLRDKLTNPFYYTDLPEWVETPKINKILLEKIRKEYDKKILLFMYHHEATDYEFIKNKYNLNKIPHIKTRFYYMYSHKSSLGNEYIAKFYFKALLGEKNFSLNRIQCFFSQKTNSRSKLSKIDLSLVNNIQILERDNLLSVLNKNFPGEDNSYKKNKVKDTKHFISFVSSDDFFGKPLFPISFPLKDSQKLYLKLDSKNIIELGEIRALDSHHIFFIFYADYIKKDLKFVYDYPYNNYFKVKDLPPKLKELLKNRRKPINLLIGKHKMGKLYPGLYQGEKIFSFFSKKQHKHSFLMMGPSSGLVREKNFKEEFSPEMLYIMKDGTKIRSPIPDWKCKKIQDKIKLELPNFSPIQLQ